MRWVAKWQALQGVCRASIEKGRRSVLFYSWNTLNAVADYLKEGQKVRVKVLEADEKGRVRLSMKALTAEEGGGVAITSAQ